jgi:hypothetical protein
VLSGSACTAIRPLVESAPRDGTIVSVGEHAAYLRVGADVLSVLTARAARLPCGVVLTPGTSLPASLVAGQRVRVGDGALTWGDGTGDWRVRPLRWWAPAVVRPGARSAAGSDRLRALLRHVTAASASAEPQPWLAEALDAAARSLAGGQPEDAAGACLQVIGRGRGSTPSGDDAVAGLLLAARALLPVDGVGEGHEPARQLSALAERVATVAPNRTTAVSAALLRHAAAGRAVGTVVEAVDVLVDRSPDPHPDDVLRRLLALGHGSGVDTAAGLLAAADHLPTPA